MINHHPRPSPAHNGADTLPHFIIVAVDGTFAARGLVGAETAAVEAVESVVRISVDSHPGISVITTH